MSNMYSIFGETDLNEQQQAQTPLSSLFQPIGSRTRASFANGSARSHTSDQKIAVNRKAGRISQIEAITNGLSTSAALLLPKLSATISNKEDNNDRASIALLEQDPLLQKACGGFRQFVHKSTDLQLIKCANKSPEFNTTKQLAPANLRYIHILRNSWKSLTQFDRMDWENQFVWHQLANPMLKLDTSLSLEGPAGCEHVESSPHNLLDCGAEQRQQLKQWCSSLDSEHLPCPLCSFESQRRFNIGELLPHLSNSHYAVHLYACHCCSRAFPTVDGLKAHASECKSFRQFMRESVRLTNQDLIFDFGYASLICAECGIQALLSPRCDRETLADTLLNIFLIHSCQSMVLCLVFSPMELERSSVLVRFVRPNLLEPADPCPHCSRTEWHNVLELEQHCIVEHSTELKSSKCPKCATSFHTAALLHDHLQDVHSDIPTVVHFLRQSPLLPPALDKSGIALIGAIHCDRESLTKDSLKWLPPNERKEREKERGAKTLKRGRRKRKHQEVARALSSQLTESEEDDAESVGMEEASEMCVNKTMKEDSLGYWQKKRAELEAKALEASLSSFGAQLELNIVFTGRVIVQNTLNEALPEESVFQCAKCWTICMGEEHIHSHLNDCNRELAAISLDKLVADKKIHAIFDVNSQFHFMPIRCALCTTNSRSANCCSIISLRRHYAEEHAIFCGFSRNKSTIQGCATAMKRRDWLDTAFDRELRRLIKQSIVPTCTSELDSSALLEEYSSTQCIDLTPAMLHSSLINSASAKESEVGKGIQKDKTNGKQLLECKQELVEEEEIDNEQRGIGGGGENPVDVQVKQEVLDDEMEERDALFQGGNGHELEEVDASLLEHHVTVMDTSYRRGGGRGRGRGRGGSRGRRRRPMLEMIRADTEIPSSSGVQNTVKGRRERKAPKRFSPVTRKLQQKSIEDSSGGNEAEEDGSEFDACEEGGMDSRMSMEWMEKGNKNGKVEELQQTDAKKAYYVCFLCTFVEHTTDKFGKHLNTHPEQWEKCPLCDADKQAELHFAHPVQFFKHISEQHMDIQNNEVRCLSCSHLVPIPSRVHRYRAIAAQFRHVVYECVGADTCALCGWKPQGNDGPDNDLITHRLLEHRLLFDRFICSSCKCGFYSRDKFLAHQCELALRCICDPTYRFQTRAEYSLHFQQHIKAWKSHGLLQSDYEQDSTKRLYIFNDDYQRMVEEKIDRQKEEEVEKAAFKAVEEIKKKMAILKEDARKSEETRPMICRGRRKRKSQREKDMPSALKIERRQRSTSLSMREKGPEKTKIMRILTEAHKWVQLEAEQRERQINSDVPTTSEAITTVPLTTANGNDIAPSAPIDTCATASLIQFLCDEVVIENVLESVVNRVEAIVDGRRNKVKTNVEQTTTGEGKEEQQPQQLKNTLNCPKCHLIFHSNSALEQHKTMAHLEYLSMPLDTITSLCRRCCIAFQDSQRYFQHMKGHYPRPVACRRCSCVCASEADYERHKEAHNRTVEYVCSICLVRYTGEMKLAHHIAKVHAKTLAYFCKSCGLCSTALRTVLAHIFIEGQCTKQLTVDHVGVCHADQLRFLPANSKDKFQFTKSADCRHMCLLACNEQVLITCNDCTCPIPLNAWKNTFYPRDAPDFQYKEQCALAEDDFALESTTSIIYQLLLSERENRPVLLCQSTEERSMQGVLKRLHRQLQLERSGGAKQLQYGKYHQRMPLLGIGVGVTSALTPMGDEKKSLGNVAMGVERMDIGEAEEGTTEEERVTGQKSSVSKGAIHFMPIGKLLANGARFTSISSELQTRHSSSSPATSRSVQRTPVFVMRPRQPHPTTATTITAVSPQRQPNSLSNSSTPFVPDYQMIKRTAPGAQPPFRHFIVPSANNIPKFVDSTSKSPIVLSSASVSPVDRSNERKEAEEGEVTEKNSVEEESQHKDDDDKPPTLEQSSPTEEEVTSLQRHTMVVVPDLCRGQQRSLAIAANMSFPKLDVQLPRKYLFRAAAQPPVPRMRFLCQNRVRPPGQMPSILRVSSHRMVPVVKKVGRKSYNSEGSDEGEDSSLKQQPKRRYEHTGRLYSGHVFVNASAANGSAEPSCSAGLIPRGENTVIYRQNYPPIRSTLLPIRRPPPLLQPQHPIGSPPSSLSSVQPSDKMQSAAELETDATTSTHLANDNEFEREGGK